MSFGGQKVQGLSPNPTSSYFIPALVQPLLTWASMPGVEEGPESHLRGVVRVD